ncbi:DMT family transporter [Streptomyces sp. ISL-10]|uniref:DMT family transporter n=1 Tax=Streptomyces sp. ISL-10 TaxID=2819172 RepID=UPI001BE52A37|nr:DMT family transporter [Streptomyces sp. ISL-10]MBT2368230.1 DMT family transporter [Streptomyces sp. ISL-10]
MDSAKTINTPKSKDNPYLLLTVTMVLWGSAFSSSKTVVEQLPYSVAAFLRFGGGAIALLLAVRLFGRRDARVAPRDRGRAALAGLLGVFVYNLSFFWGLSLAPSMDAGVIVPVMSPVLTTAFLLITRKESASPARIAGLGLGVVGAVVFFVGASTGGGGATRLTGDLLFLLSAVCWAAFTLSGPRVLAGIEPLRATAYATCAGAVALGLFSAPRLGDVNWGELPTGVWLNVVFLAVGPTALANLLYYRGVGTVGPASASVMMFLVPVFGSSAAMIFLDESFGAVQAAGALVLLAGAVLAVTQGRLPGRRGPAGDGNSAHAPRRVRAVTDDA